jgi:hypothetical protein
VWLAKTAKTRIGDEMSRTCRDCDALKKGTGNYDEPHEYLVMTGRSIASGAAFYRCLLCNTFLTFAPEDGAPRWDAGFRPHNGGAGDHRALN